MRELKRSPATLVCILGIAAVAYAGAVQAQSFSASYDLLRAQESAAQSALAVRLAPTFRDRDGVSGVGLSLQAGRNWFGELGVGKIAPGASGGAGADILSVGGGYRWGDGQSLSLQVSRGRGEDQRLGLALNYDWPKYFVRFSWDSKVNLAPQDTLRFSAGIRF